MDVASVLSVGSIDMTSSGMWLVESPVYQCQVLARRDSWAQGICRQPVATHLGCSRDLEPLLLQCKR